MPPSQDRIAMLRAELAKLSGPARYLKLMQLGQALIERYARTGPGSPAGLPDLNGVIDAWSEAYGYLEPRDQRRGIVANWLGWPLAIRHGVHGGDVADRDRAIQLLEESLGFTSLPPMDAASGRLLLSQLYHVQAMRGILAMGLNASPHSIDPALKAAANRAVDHLRQILESPRLSIEITNFAQTFLPHAEAVRDLLDAMGGGPLGLDTGRLQKVFTTMQTVHAQVDRWLGTFGYGRVAGFNAGGVKPFTPGGGPGPLQPMPQFDVDTIVAEPSMDRPVMVVEGSEPPAPPVAPKPPPAAVPADLKRLRAALAEQFARLAATAAGQPEPAQRTDGSPEAYQLAVGLLRPDGPPLPVDAVDDCVALATTVVHEAEAADPAGAGVDRFLLAVALFLRACGDAEARDGVGATEDGWYGADGDGWTDADRWGDSAAGDLAAGFDSLLRAAETLPPEHPAATAALTGFAAFLDDRQPLRSLTDDVARRFADRAEAIAAVHTRAEARTGAGSRTVTESDVAVVRTVAAVCRAVTRVRASSVRDAAAASDQAAAIAEAVPVEYPWRFRLRAAAGAAAVAEALAMRDAAALRSAGAQLAQAIAEAPARYARTRGPRTLKRLAEALVGLGGDAAALRQAVDGLAEVCDAEAGSAEAVRLHALLGGLRLALLGADRVTRADGADGLDAAAEAGLTAAIESLELATARLTDDLDAVLRGGSWWRLAEAYRRLGTMQGQQRYRQAALRALRCPSPPAAAARGFAGWMLDGGGAYEAFEALEVATLAEDERLDPLLRDVATVLLGPAARAKAPAAEHPTLPTVGEVAAALRTVEATALVYLHPLPGRPHTVGILLLDAAAERLGLLGTVVVPDVSGELPAVDWTDRARAALVEPLLALTPATGAGPRRVLVAATGALGRLPLGVIRAAGRYAASDLVVSFVRSGRQVVELARRTPLSVTRDVVFVANPRGDRDLASFEAMTLRRIFHPHSIGLGRTIEQVHGRGTPADVLAHLPGPAGPGAGLLHLGCALRTTGSPGLELAEPQARDTAGGGPAANGTAAGGSTISGAAAGGAGPGAASARAVLDVAQIAAQAGEASSRDSGGLAILPADAGADHARWVSFADTLLDAGLTGVIGWLWPVPEHVATLMQVVLHGKLVDEGLPPARAVHEVQRWMLDPDRVVPPYLPAGLLAALGDADLADPRYWAALAHRGR